MIKAVLWNISGVIWLVGAVTQDITAGTRGNFAWLVGLACLGLAQLQDIADNTKKNQ